MECALCLVITASLRQVHIRGRGGHVHGGGLAAGRRPALPHPARGCLQRAPGVALRVRDGAGARLPARAERAAQVTTHTVTLTLTLTLTPARGGLQRAPVTLILTLTLTLALILTLTLLYHSMRQCSLFSERQDHTR